MSEDVVTFVNVDRVVGLAGFTEDAELMLAVMASTG